MMTRMEFVTRHSYFGAAAMTGEIDRYNETKYFREKNSKKDVNKNNNNKKALLF